MRVDWLRILQISLLVLLPCACYWPALNGAFLWDDETLITKSAVVHAADGLRKIWFSTVPFDYFPLTNTTFWLEWRLWGENPLGYHLFNLALHVASAFLFWRLLRVLRLPGAWFAALLFAVHPINVASVAWIAERKNVLSMVFYLGSLICYVRSEERQTGNVHRRHYLAALGLFILAALSKSSVVMLPCVLLLLAWWREGRLRLRDLWRSIPFFAVSTAAGLVTIWFQYHRTMTAETLASAYPPLLRLVYAGRAICFYLGKVVWPQPLAMLYPHWEMSLRDAVNYLWPAAVIALLAAVWWGRKFWGRGPVAALGYFVLSLLPVSGLLHMSFFKYSNVSDHFAYLAGPGLFALAGASLMKWYGRGPNAGRAALVVMTGIITALGLICFQRAGDYSSSERLWRSTLEVNPDSFAAHNCLGAVFQERGRKDPEQYILAEHQFREAVRLEKTLGSAAASLAGVLRSEGRWAESADLYRKVLPLRPDPDDFNSYGADLFELGDTAGARAAYQNALRLVPTLETTYYNLYGVELAEHHLPQACAMLRTCLRINPDSIPALTALVMLNLDQAGGPALPPLAAEAMIALAERACQLTQYQSAPQLVLLSKANLATGRRNNAIDVAAQAQEAALAHHETEMAAAIEQYQLSLRR